MTAHVCQNEDLPGAAVVSLSRGDGFGVVLRIDPAVSDANAAKFSALRGRTWKCDIRPRAGGVGDPSGSLTKTESLDDDGALLLAFTLESSTALAETSYVFDCRPTSGPRAGTVEFAGSTITVASTSTVMP